MYALCVLLGPSKPNKHHYLWTSYVVHNYRMLSNNSFHGTLPAAWRGCVSLEQLGLDSNNFTGTLPASWGSLERLQILNLSSNGLQGGLPLSWGGMSELQVRMYMAVALQTH